jgi:hypothetical protein
MAPLLPITIDAERSEAGIGGGKLDLGFLV